MNTTPRRIRAGIELSAGENAPAGSSKCAGSADSEFRLSISVLVLNLSPANFVSWYLSHIVWSKSARFAVPWVTETARKSGCLNDQISAFSALRIRFSHGPAMSVLSQACFGIGL